MNRSNLLLTLAIIALTISACSGAGTNPPVDLDGTSWTLTTLNGRPVLEGSLPTLAFEDGQVSGNGSCNGFGGEYAQDGSELTIGPLMSTLMACIPQEITDQESAYFAALAKVAGFAIENGELHLLDDQGIVLMTLSR